MNILIGIVGGSLFLLALLFMLGAGRRAHDADEIMDRAYHDYLRSRKS